MKVEKIIKMIDIWSTQFSGVDMQKDITMLKDLIKEINEEDDE